MFGGKHTDSILRHWSSFSEIPPLHHLLHRIIWWSPRQFHCL